MVLLAAQRVLSQVAEVVMAYDVASALAQLETMPFDLVLTDYDLGPGLTGLDLISTIQARWPSIVAVLVTGSLTSTLQTTALAAGARACLAKPSTAGQLRSTLLVRAQPS